MNWTQPGFRASIKCVKCVSSGNFWFFCCIPGQVSNRVCVSMANAQISFQHSNYLAVLGEAATSNERHKLI